PSRRALARQIIHLADAGVPLQGMSNHGVSEAIYLADPEGNGIEIYRDRPPEQWVYRDGRLHMTTEPLDVGAVLAEVGDRPEPWAGIPAETVMGHVHLRVADLARAEAFYREVLGLDVTTRYGQAA